MEKRTLQIPVDKVVIELQHAHIGVLQNKEPHVYGQGVRDGFLVHRYIVRIVDDDVELSLTMSDAAFSVQYFTSRCRSTFVMFFP